MTSSFQPLEFFLGAFLFIMGLSLMLLAFLFNEDNQGVSNLPIMTQTGGESSSSSMPSSKDGGSDWGYSGSILIIKD